MSAPASHGHRGQVDGGIAVLDALAARLRDRGWTAYLNPAPGRVPRLCAAADAIIWTFRRPQDAPAIAAQRPRQGAA